MEEENGNSTGESEGESGTEIIKVKNTQSYDVKKIYRFYYVNLISAYIHRQRRQRRKKIWRKLHLQKNIFVVGRMKRYFAN